MVRAFVLDSSSSFCEAFLWVDHGTQDPNTSCPQTDGSSDLVGWVKEISLRDRYVAARSTPSSKC